MASTLRHFSHVHPLKLMSGTAESCGACGLPIKSENLFGCQPCGFFLHRFCALQYRPTLHQHPAHPQDLHLLYASHYRPGRFRCNICGMVGEGWNYHCDPCKFDAHLLCTSMPRTVRRPGHQHPLQLWFRPPSEGSTNCHACRLQIRHYCYKCSSCDFVLHPGCLRKPLATDSTKPQATTDSKRKQSKSEMAWQVARWALLVGQVVGGLDGLGDAEADDVPDAEADDVPDSNDDFSLYMPTFDDLPGADGVGYPLDEEANSLLLAHMEMMYAGDVPFDMLTFEDPLGPDGVDYPLDEEATSLLLAHIERMGGGNGPSSSS